jgi:GMP synthase-like glutamine amidotransferase
MQSFWNPAFILYNGILKVSMKKNLLLINCYREKAEEKIRGYHEWLEAGAAAAGMRLAIRAASDRLPLPDAGEFSALIVSGSQKMVGDGEVEAGLLEFLAGSRRPLLGICYGHQVMARAFGCLVTRDGQKHLGDEDIGLKKADRLFSGFPVVFKMRESHEEIVARDGILEKKFRVLAESSGGLVEAIVHREYPLYGVQFHPEKSGEIGINLLVNFLKMLTD